MDILTILKLTPSLVRFAGDAMMYSGSQYAVRCEAPEFRTDVDTPASLALEDDGWTEFASCVLSADPLRRGVRVGELSLAADIPDGRCWLCARMGGSVVFRDEVVVFAPR